MRIAETPTDPILSYTTLDGRTLDLSSLSDDERSYLERCLQVYRRGRLAKHFHELANLVTGRGNPLLAHTGGRVTQAVWDQPLYQAVRDLEDRLGIRVGELDPAPGDNLWRDPLEDEWLPSVQAAALKGVTLAAIHKAIARGDVVGRPARIGGTRMVVSTRSLEHWSPNAARQAAGRQAR